MALSFRSRVLVRLVLPACIIAATAASAAAQTAPGIHFSPAEGSIGESTPTVTITWTHGTDLNAGSRVIQVTKDGVTTTVTSSFSYSVEMQDPNTTGVLMAKSAGAVSLSSTGTTVVRGYICGTDGGCGESTAGYVYTPPPPPADRAVPSVSFAPYSRAVRDATRDGASISYSTPAYVSLGQERSLTLFYSSELATPHPLITMDVTDHSLSPAASFSVKARSAGGTDLTLSNGQKQAYYANTGGATGDTVRIGVQFDITGLGAGNKTGVHLVTVEVTSHWSNSSETKSSTETVPVMVLDLTSPLYGRGWWVLGLQRAYPGPQGIMVHNGDGTLLLFSGSGPTYASPPGERSTVSRIAGDSIRRAYPDGSVAIFTPAGTLAYVRSLAGQQVTYAYGDVSQLTSVTDPAGLQTTLAYGSDATFGRYLSSITTPGGRQTSVVHSSSFTVQEFFDPDGVRALRQVRNSVGRMTSAVDRSGGAWNTSYHSIGQRLQTLTPWITARGQAVRPRSRAYPERLAYIPGGGQGTSTAPMARVRPRDVNARFTGALDETTHVWSDRFGLPLKIVGPLGHTTEVQRDTVGRPTAVSAPDGMQTLVNWNDDGNVDQSFSEAEGEQTTTEYGTFSGVKLPIKIVQGGREIRYRRDSLGRVLAVVVQGDTMVWLTYDSRSRVQTFHYRDGQEVRNFYDGTAWKNADSVRVVSSSGPQTTAFTFDPFGRVRTVRDPSGRVTTDSVDRVGRLMKRRAPGDSVRFAYDSVGLRRVTDAAGKVFETQRNRVGWVDREIDPNGRISTISYDSAGRVVGTTDRLGRTAAYQYDVLGRTTRNLVGTDTIHYRYHDPDGDWFVVRNAESRDSVTYNAAGKVASTVTTMNGVTYRVTNDYGSSGLQTYRHVASPAAGTAAWTTSVGYVYDSRQRLAGITDSPGNTSTGVAYDVPGRLQKLTYPGTIGTLTLGYDPRSQISYNSYSNGSLQGAFGASLAYDVLGRRTGRTGQSGYRKRLHSYDGPGRMTWYSDERWTYFPPELCNPEFPDGSCEGHYAWQSVGSGSYGYDAVGNRTSWSVTDSLGTTTSSGATLQPTSNRYASFDGWTLTYDSIGNLVRRQKGSEDITYQWNARGQLTSVWTAASGTVTYGYNGLGMRVRRTQGGVPQRYLYDDAFNLVAEIGSTGNPLRTYTHLGLDQPHSMRTWSGTTPGAVHYYALDLPGNNVNGLFNGSGTVTNRYYYSPWGQAQSTSEATYNPLRYASRELDPASGLYYNRARWYDPFLGRFISEDPIGIDGGINVYAYAGNDPVNFTDPFGLSACPGPTCLDPITVVGRPRARGWMRKRWDDLQGNRRWGGIRDGSAPTSIMGDWEVSHDDGSLPSLDPAVDTGDQGAATAQAQPVNACADTYRTTRSAAALFHCHAQENARVDALWAPFFACVAAAPSPPFSLRQDIAHGLIGSGVGGLVASASGRAGIVTGPLAAVGTASYLNARADAKYKGALCASHRP